MILLMAVICAFAWKLANVKYFEILFIISLLICVVWLAIKDEKFMIEMRNIINKEKDIKSEEFPKTLE